MSVIVTASRSRSLALVVRLFASFVASLFASACGSEGSQVVPAVDESLGTTESEVSSYQLSITNPGFETTATSWYPNQYPLRPNARTAYYPSGRQVTTSGGVTEVGSNNYNEVVYGWAQSSGAESGAWQGIAYPTEGIYGLAAHSGRNNLYMYTTNNIGYWHGVYQVLPDTFAAANYTMSVYAGKNFGGWGGADIKLGVKLADGSVRWLAQRTDQENPENNTYKLVTAAYRYDPADAALIDRPMVVYLGTCFMEGWSTYDDVSVTATFVPYALRVANPGFETVSTWNGTSLAANARTTYRPSGNLISTVGAATEIGCQDPSQLVSGWTRVPGANDGALQGTAYPTTGVYGYAAHGGRNDLYFYTTNNIWYSQGFTQVLPDVFMPASYKMSVFAGGAYAGHWGGADIKLGVQKADGTIQWLAQTTDTDVASFGGNPWKQVTASYTYGAADAALLGRPMVVYLGSCFAEGWGAYDDVNVTATPVPAPTTYTVNDFEGGYVAEPYRAGGGESGGTATASVVSAPVHGGTHALGVRYDFTRVGYNYSNVSIVQPIPARPTSFSVWVYTSAPHPEVTLSYRFRDATGRTWQGGLGAVDWSGWKKLGGAFDPGLMSWGGWDTPGGGFTYPLSFSQFTISGTTNDGQRSTGDLAFDDLQATSTVALDEGTVLSHRGVWAQDGSPGPVLVHNLLGVRRTLRVSYSLYDGKGRLAASSYVDLTLDPDQLSSVSIPVHRGYYTVQASVSEPGFPSWSNADVFPLAVVPPVPSGTQPAQMLALNGHLDARGVKPLGGAFVRGDFPWRQIEYTATGGYSFGPQDTFVDDANAAGLEVLGVLGYNPSWVQIPSDPIGMGTQNDRYLSYVTATVNHFKQKGVHTWSLWNEPDYSWTGWSQRFGQLAWDAYYAIKAADPTAIVIYASAPQDWTSRSLDYLYNPKFPFDALDLHTYAIPMGQSPAQSQRREQLQSARSWLNSVEGGAGKPIWITELGWPTGGTDADALQSKVDLPKQAAYIAQMLAIARGEKVKKTFVYWTFDDAGVHVSRESHFGLLFANGDAKPSAAAYAQAAYRIGATDDNATFIDRGSTRRIYLFQTSAQAIAMVWTTGQAETINSPTWPAAAIVEDYDGAPITRQSCLPIEERPVYIVVPIANKAALQGALTSATFTTTCP